MNRGKKSKAKQNGRKGGSANYEEMAADHMDTEENNRSQNSMGLEQNWPGGSSYFHGGAQSQSQIQQQLQRSIEASKQMLYGVFGNVITMLEEYEQRELAQFRIQHNMPKSDIYIPDQRFKSFADIESNVECQLLLFETQTKACPPEALVEVHEELKRRTLAWSAARAEVGIQDIHQTDRYIGKLYEILAKGGTSHRIGDKCDVTEETMRDTFQSMIYGDHDRAELDKEFKTNPNKEAVGPNTRSSEMIKEGAERISRARGDQDLDHCLKDDVEKSEKNGPYSIQ